MNATKETSVQKRAERIRELKDELADLLTPLCPRHNIRYNVELDPACPQCAIQRTGG